jgi:uncharacterized membrane protein AbrB (regulator of aidB expression)
MRLAQLAFREPMIANIGLFLIGALFVAWAAALVALPILTLTGMLLRRNADAARPVNLVAFGMAVGCAVFILSTAVGSRFSDLRLDTHQAAFAWAVVVGSLVLSVPCALIAARFAAVARQELERAGRRG